jgi:hypothetical protein
MQQTALGQSVGYQWIDQQLQRLQSCFSLLWGILSAATLVRDELLVWKMVQAMTTVAVGTLLLWTHAVGPTGLMAVDTSLLLCGVGLGVSSFMCGTCTNRPRLRDTTL